MAYGPVRFIWLRPTHGPGGPTVLPESAAEILTHPAIGEYMVLDGRPRSMLTAVRRLLSSVGGRDTPLMAVGFTSLLYVAPLRPKSFSWFVNGIPEEILLGGDTPSRRAYVDALWRVVGLVRAPDLVVTVSQVMADLISARLGPLRYFVAPNGTDLKLFRPQAGLDRQYFTYLGTGAPWQGLDDLAKLWAAIYHVRPQTQFRVISRDRRVSVLGNSLPPDSIEFVEAADPSEVARFLWEASLGFAVRTPSLVNRVSFPTKFAEYVAAGAPVAVSAIGWDVSTIVSETRCGLLLEPPFDEGGYTQSILSYMDGTSEEERTMSVRRAGELLDEDALAQVLAETLPR